MTVEDCIIIGGSQLRWYLPSVAPRTSTVWYGVIFLSETRRQLVHRHNLPPAQCRCRFKITKPSQLPLKRLRGCQQIVIGESLSRDKEGKITEICWTRLFQEILQHPGLKKITLNQSWLICRKLAFGKMLPVNPYFYIFVTKLSFV